MKIAIIFRYGINKEDWTVVIYRNGNNVKSFNCDDDCYQDAIDFMVAVDIDETINVIYNDIDDLEDDEEKRNMCIYRLTNLDMEYLRSRH